MRTQTERALVIQQKKDAPWSKSSKKFGRNRRKNDAMRENLALLEQKARHRKARDYCGTSLAATSSCPEIVTVELLTPLEASKSTAASARTQYEERECRRQNSNAKFARSLRFLFSCARRRPKVNLLFFCS